jgi:hypothetical protein
MWQWYTVYRFGPIFERHRITEFDRGDAESHPCQRQRGFPRAASDFEKVRGRFDPP